MNGYTAPTITLKAHAKINLVLRVLEREASGYHRIETIFQRLALADDVAITITDGEKTLDVAWDGQPAADIGAPERNLAWRAAAAYHDATGWPAGWHIALTKRIPAGAGLGGGSSDAAAVLRALERLAPAPMGAGALQILGASLGADVAFFVSDESLAIGRGRGDQLRPIPALPKATVVLAVPNFGVSTAAAYADLDNARAGWATNPPGPILRDTDDLGSWAAIAKLQANEFEPTVFAQHPDLEIIRRQFEAQGARIARLSGSGSVVFGLWPDRPAVRIAHPGIRILTTNTA